MSDTNTKKIAELNDLCRKAMGVAGKLFQTVGIDALPSAAQSGIDPREGGDLRHLRTGQRSPRRAGFRGVHAQRRTHFLKIDYYDRTMTKGSEDPSDPGQTVRLLTIMLASEY